MKVGVPIGAAVDAEFGVRTIVCDVVCSPRVCGVVWVIIIISVYLPIASGGMCIEIIRAAVVSIVIFYYDNEVVLARVIEGILKIDPLPSGIGERERALIYSGKSREVGNPI